MDSYMGQITGFGGNFAPKNWALCNGGLMGIAQFSALFSILGTTFGGNGVQTFGLPDLRGRVAIGAGNGPGLTPRVLGEMSGEENVTLQSTQMPMHNHLLNVNGTANAGSAGLPTGNFLSATADPNTGTDLTIYAPASTGAQMSPAAIGMAGGNQPHDNMQPYLAINYIICLAGLFPSRN